MAIRTKRRLSGDPGPPNGLVGGELAFNEVDLILYYGWGLGPDGRSAASVIPIAGVDLATGISEAPRDGFYYGRVDLGWGRVAPLASPVFSGTVQAPVFQADTGIIVLAGNISAPSGNVTGVNLAATVTMSVGGVAVATTAQLPDIATVSKLGLVKPDGITTTVDGTGKLVAVGGGATPSTTAPSMDGLAAIGVSAAYARADHVHPSDTSRAALASPVFTGTVQAPVFVADTGITVQAGNISAPSGSVTGVNVAATTGNMTVGGVNVATTAQLPAAAATLPVMDGTALAGANLTYSRSDHVHPTDTSRAPLANPIFTGTVRGVTFVADTGITVQVGNISAPSGNVSGVNVYATGTMSVNGVGVALTASPTFTGMVTTPDLTLSKDASQSAVSGAWTVVTAPVAAQSGTWVGSANLRYKKIGRTVFVTMQVVGVTNTSGAGAINITMPFAAATPAGTGMAIFNGLDPIGHKTLIGYMTNNSAILSFFNSDTTFPASNGNAFFLAGVYETAT